MKIPVAKLKPNPFRDMKNYPIRKEKLQALIDSIEDLTFWDNILARPQNGHYEIAYGHHRMLALQKVMPRGKVDIPVRRLNDTEMLRIMAQENAEEWGGTAQADLETIRTVRKYLADRWSDAGAISPSIVQMMKKANKQDGPGRTMIAEFLGGTWKESRVHDCLKILLPIERGEVDEETVKGIRSTTTARDFVGAVRKLPKDKQRKIADDLTKGGLHVKALKASAIKEGTRPPKRSERDEVREAMQGLDADSARLLREVKVHKRFLREVIHGDAEKWARRYLVATNNLWLTLDDIFKGDDSREKKRPHHRPLGRGPRAIRA